MQQPNAPSTYHTQGVRQAETEFYLWQSSSQYPFCQVMVLRGDGWHGLQMKSVAVM